MPDPWDIINEEPVDMTPLPPTVEGFVQHFGREPASDSELEHYYPDDPADPAPIDPWKVVSEAPIGSAASLAGASGTAPAPPSPMSKLGAGIAERWENTPTSFTEPSLLGIAKSTYEGARDLARLPGEVAAGPSSAPGTEEYEQQRRALEDKTTQVAADVANPLGTGGLLAGVGVGRTAAFRTTKPIARASEKPQAWEVVKEEPIAPAANQQPMPQPLSGAATQTAPSGNAPLPPTPAQAEAAVLARIGEQPKSPMYNKTDAYTDFVDNLHPIRKIVENTGKPVDTILNPYEQFRLSRGVGGKSEHFLRHGTFDYDTFKNVGPSFANVMRPVEKDKESFKAYLMAKRALELEPQGVETGMPLDAARVVVANGAAKFDKAAQSLQKYQSDLLDYVKQSGLLSDDAVSAMRQASKDYVPFHRVMDDPRVASSAPGKGFTTRTPTYRMKGSERMVVDPLESVIRNTNTFITLAERNRALTTLVEFAEANPGSVPMRKVSQVRPIEVHGNEITRTLEDMGIPSQMYGNPDAFNIFRKANTMLAPDEIAVWKDGKRQVYQTDPQIADIVKGMDQEALQLWQRVAAYPARWLRAGVVLSPEYMVRNITRDQMNAFAQTKHGYRPVYDMMRGLWQVGTEGKAYQQWLKGGGAQSALVAMDREYAARDIWKYGPDPTLMNRAKNVISTPIEILRIVSGALDNATRLGEFMRATKGKDDIATTMRGSMAARDVTQDFQRLGAKMRAYNAITGFAGAQVQGLDREISNLRHNWPKVVPKLAAMITLPSVYLWAANRGDPRYEKASNWEKDAFWFILPEDKNTQAAKVPKPFTLGMTFGSLVERTLSAYFDKKPEAYNEFLKHLSGTMLPNMTPTFAVPMIEQFSNRNIFLNRPLVPERLARGEKSEQFTAQTPEVAKLAGQGVSKIPGMGDNSFSSPIALQNYVRQWGGTMGQYAMSAADKGLAATGVTDKAPGPAMTFADIPIIRAFVSRYPSAAMQPIQDFYRKHGALQEFVTSERNARQRGVGPTADTERLGLAKQTAAIARQMGTLNREIRDIYEDRKMSPAEKRTKIQEGYMDMLGKSEYGLKILREAEKRKYQGPD